MKTKKQMNLQAGNQRGGVTIPFITYTVSTKQGLGDTQQMA